MPYKDANKRREYNRKWMKSKYDEKNNKSATSSCELPILEPLPLPSKNDRFTSYNNNFREKLRLIEDQNKLRLRQLADGSIQWKITVSDGVDYVDTTPYMPLSYL